MAIDILSAKWKARGAGLDVHRFMIYLLISLTSLGRPGEGRGEKGPPLLADGDVGSPMTLEVTSAARKKQEVGEAAAATYILTQEDIRRSGMTCIPELLRLIPGLSVAQIDANKWAIGARSSSGRFSSRLLLLMDGRRVYTPLFNGVYWDVQDALLEDIDRIEVILGPDASLWGVNALDGVINIITKQASDTQGGLLTAGAGNQEQGFGSLRYGWPLGASAHARGYAKYFNRNDSSTPAGLDAFDNWNMLRGGTRFDWRLSRRDLLTLQGDIYEGHENQMVSRMAPSPPYQVISPSRTPFSGGNLVGTWTRTLSESSDLNLQAYYDRISRDDPLLGEVRKTISLDFQHHFKAGKIHNLGWNLSFLHTADQISGRGETIVQPASRRDHLLSIYLQDELQLIHARLRVILSYNLSHNGYTGVEGQPDIRLWWSPRRSQKVWVSASRAVRIPSRMEKNGLADVEILPGEQFPLAYAIQANPGVGSEVLSAFEAGYRMERSKQFFFEFSVYSHFYEHPVNLQPESPRFIKNSIPPYYQLPFLFINGPRGKSQGAEFWATWTVTKFWKLIPAYTWTNAHLNRDKNSIGRGSPVLVSDVPHHQAQIRTQLDLPQAFECDMLLYSVSRIPGEPVPAYIRVDCRLGWSWRHKLDFDLVLQNLQESQHPEFFSTFGVLSTEVRRSLHAKITLNF